MRKQNPMLAKIEARHQAEMTYARIFAVQQSKDIMLIAANRAFNFGPERAKLLADTFDEVFTEYATMTVEDSRDDKDIWYTKAKIDQALQEICGESFVPWEERYTAP